VPATSWPGFSAASNDTGKKRVADLLLDDSEMKSLFGHHFKPTYSLLFFSLS
jgi:hypothetical protein